MQYQFSVIKNQDKRMIQEFQFFRKSQIHHNLVAEVSIDIFSQDRRIRFFISIWLMHLWRLVFICKKRMIVLVGIF